MYGSYMPSPPLGSISLALAIITSTSLTAENDNIDPLHVTSWGMCGSHGLPRWTELFLWEDVQCRNNYFEIEIIFAARLICKA